MQLGTQFMIIVQNTDMLYNNSILKTRILTKIINSSGGADGNVSVSVAQTRERALRLNQFVQTPEEVSLNDIINNVIYKIPCDGIPF
jgi:hypothetical protein